MKLGFNTVVMLTFGSMVVALLVVIWLLAAISLISLIS